MMRCFVIVWFVVVCFFWFLVWWWCGEIMVNVVRCRIMIQCRGVEV